MRKLVRKFIIIPLCKIELLRNHNKFFETAFKAFVLKDPMAIIIKNGIYTNFYRSIFFFCFAPKKFWGGYLLNLIGLPFVRYYYHNLRIKLRFFYSKNFDEDLQNKGIKIYNNFLSQENLDYVKNFYKNNQNNFVEYFKDFGELIISNTNGVVRKEKDYIEFIDYLEKNINLTKIGHQLTGTKFSVSPFVSIIHYKSFVDHQQQEDGQNIPHTDVFYPSYKIFIYLNDVNDDNGAFRYLEESHKFSFKNAVNYYKNTIKYYRENNMKNYSPTDASATLYPNDFKWNHAHGKAGDAVFFNVQGIHRRGEFKKDQFRERIVLLIDYRQAEVLFQSFAKNV